MTVLRLLFFFSLYSHFYSTIANANEFIDTIPELHDAGFLLTDANGDNALSANENKAYTPASTTKLVTAWLALQNWGEDHHFKTSFYIDENTHTLWIKGSGDPYLVSEELHLIAKKLKQRGLAEVNTIALDNSVFKAHLSVPGASQTNNPYDAIPSALAANFNTLNVEKNSSKDIVSSEKQTPITKTAKKIAAKQTISHSPIRINTGFSLQDSERYFAELMIIFLRQQHIKVRNHIIWQPAPHQPPYYTHLNSKSLGETVQVMLKYSTNFIANQLALMMAAEFYQYPADFDDVHRYIHFNLQNYFGWQDFNLQEGAGLSHKNHLTPAQLVLLLKEFKQWKHLLPNVTKNVIAKSGTLTGVSTLAGYYMDDTQKWNAFALMMNQSVHHSRRNQIIRKLIHSLTQKK